ALLVALFGKAQLVLCRLHIPFAVAALAVEVVVDDALRLAVVAIPGLAAVRSALAGDDVLVVQEFAVVRPLETMTVPAAAVGELALPAMSGEPRERCEG